MYILQLHLGQKGFFSQFGRNLGFYVSLYRIHSLTLGKSGILSGLFPYLWHKRSNFSCHRWGVCRALSALEFYEFMTTQSHWNSPETLYRNIEKLKNQNLENIFLLLWVYKVILKSIADSRNFFHKKSHREVWQKGMPFSSFKKSQL